ncbi:MAG: hypothetical protein IJZ17_07015, partial [Muribaculaceae bacterium]|nr:hypothetical protein [Muribaculaceae bacterium]
VSQMENSLMYTLESETHPAGVNRVESIEAGIRFAQEYYAEYNMAPTFNECLDNFCEISRYEGANEILSYGGHSSESTGSVGYVVSEEKECDMSFKGYTQSEINSKMAKAEKEQRYHEGLVRHHNSMADHALSDADRESHTRDAVNHQKRANEWKDEYQKWKWTKPDKE